VTGLWVASYVVLWVLVLALSLMVVGLLRQFGILHMQASQGTSEPDLTLPRVEDDGPEIGSPLPAAAVEAVRAVSAVAPVFPDRDHRTLFVFLSPTCESCQHAVEPLNALVTSNCSDVQPIVIMQADDHACRSFESVFPLAIPLLCDANRRLSRTFGVRRKPFGLLYDEYGRLERKGTLLDGEHCSALLGGGPVSEAVGAEIFPPVVSREVTVGSVH
jgi:methylamine dehydrogenase accessory protein MauD